MSPNEILERFVRDLEKNPGNINYSVDEIAEYAQQHGLPLDENRFEAAKRRHHEAELEKMLSNLEIFSESRILLLSPQDVREHAQQHGLKLDEERLAKAEAAYNAARDKAA